MDNGRQPPKTGAERQRDYLARHPGLKSAQRREYKQRHPVQYARGQIRYYARKCGLDPDRVLTLIDANIDGLRLPPKGGGDT